MSTTPLSDLLKLSEAERIHLAQDLRDSIPAGSPEPAPGEEQLLEWERRQAGHRADPASAIPWDRARIRLREQFGA